MTRDGENWPEVTEAELQEWLDTKSPDYLLQSEWTVGLVCRDRHTGRVFAVKTEEHGAQRLGVPRKGRCFVHPDYLNQLRPEG